MSFKQICSEDTQFIFILIKATDTEIMKEAERTKFNKEIDIAVSDISSLEPCDRNLRPLRILFKKDRELDALNYETNELFS